MSCFASLSQVSRSEARGVFRSAWAALIFVSFFVWGVRGGAPLPSQRFSFYCWQDDANCTSWGATSAGTGVDACTPNFAGFTSGAWPATSMAFQYVRSLAPGTQQDGALFVGGPQDTGLSNSSLLLHYGRWQPQTSVRLQTNTRALAYAYAPNVVVGVGRASPSGNELLWARGIQQLVGQGAVFQLSWNTAANAQGTIFSVSGFDVVYAAQLDLWVAVGAGVNNTIAYSRDGITWVGLGTLVFASRGSAIAFSSDLTRFVATGQGPFNIAWSNDGLTWTGVSTNLMPPTGGSRIGFGVGTFVALVNNAAASGFNHSIIYSKDGGASWAGAGIPFFSLQANTVIYSEYLGVFVAGGLDPGNVGTVARSFDGVSWQAVELSNGTILSLTRAKPEFDLPVFSGGSVNRPVLVSIVESVTLTNASVVQKDLTLQGQLNLTANASLTTNGNFMVGGSLIFEQGASLSISNKLVVTGASSSLVVVLSQSAVAGTQTVNIASFGSSQGTFNQVNAISPNPCLSASVSSVNYGTTSLTAVFQVTPTSSTGPCGTTTTASTNPLSAGQIAGITIGCIAFAVLVTVAILLIYSKMRDSRDVKRRTVLRQRTLTDYSSQVSSPTLTV